VSSAAPCTTGPFFERFFSDALFEISRREELVDDLDALFPSGFTGLQLHLPPLAEKYYPKPPLFRLRFWRKPPAPIERLSTRHLAIAEEITRLAVESSELENNFATIHNKLWPDLYDCIDTVARSQLGTLHKDFDELVLNHYARPTPWVVAQLKVLYVKIWMLSAVWHFGRNEVIRQARQRGLWHGERYGDHEYRLAATADCRVAVLRMRSDQAL
jgi:hypothetical protein